jgi:hypothetical protein
MLRSYLWLGAAIAITFASANIFILAAATLPGNPSRLYQIVAFAALLPTVLWRTSFLLGSRFRVRGDGNDRDR